MSQPSTPVPSPDAHSSSTLSSPTPSQENTPDASDSSSVSTMHSSLLYTSLIGTVNSPFAADVEMLVNIPINNNPHALHSIFNDRADYWVSPDGNVLHLVFPAKLHLEGCYNKSGEYFNLPETGLDLTDIKNAEIQFEVLPLDDKEKDCPALAIGCSQFAMSLLCTLHSTAEEARNASLDAGTIPLHMPFWCTYKEDDKYSLVVTACAAFKGVLDLKTATTPQMSRTEAVTDVKSQNRMCRSDESEQGKKSNGSEPQCLRQAHDYKTKLKEGMIVELDIILKLPHGNNPTPAMSMGLHMQPLPCTKYTQPIFVDLLKDKKGKRKAMDEATGQSPTKKSSFTDVLDEDKLEYTMVE
ncbi:hypothetical protein EV702DRAFT_1045185 [Suillus placidus]|uniref:Uncharacterized protein n=1 Tax=Suillus placidus TaxID=48579 RepID=A0A9P7D457_9AGAM|nr:hypothetical protein EV702DRAFT_1045185 [Suillus placidus]